MTIHAIFKKLDIGNQARKFATAPKSNVVGVRTEDLEAMGMDLEKVKLNRSKDC